MFPKWTDSLRPLRDARRIDRRHADRAVAGEVVLGHPHALEAVPLREIDFPQRLLDDLAVRRGAPAREELEDADVHHGFISPSCRAAISGSRKSELASGEWRFD